MKTTLKLVAAGLVVFGMNSAANAFTITYLLDTVTTPGSWTLKAKTDAPGGIAAIVVDLEGATTGTSNAARTGVGSTALSGFKLGNLGDSGSPNWGTSTKSQAFAGQDTGGADSLVYGLGFRDVPVAEFSGGALPFIGDSSGNRDADGYLLLYSGTGSPTYSAVQPGDAGAVWAEEDPAVVTPIGAPETTFAYVVVPEPGALVLAGLAIPALAFALRRRKVA